MAETVAGVMTEGGAKLAKAGPGLEKAADKVSKPILPTAKKRAAAKRKSRVAKKKVATVRASKSKGGVKRRKKR